MATVASMLCLAHAGVSGAAETNGTIVLFGSSSVNDSFGHLVASDLRGHGYHVLRKGYAAAGLSRPDFVDLRAKASSLRLSAGAHSVLLYLGGNDAQSLWLYPNERGTRRQAFVEWKDEAWSEIYEKRMKNFVDLFCLRGAKSVIVIPPVEVMSRKFQHRLDRVRRLQERAVRASACGKFVADVGDAYRLATERHPLRAPDGVHMTRVGAARVWARLASRVFELVGLGEPRS